MAKGVSPGSMVGSIVLIVIIAVLGAAFTPTLQDNVDSWSENLTADGQDAAAGIVDLIPLLFWILLAVGIILALVATFLPGRLGGGGL